MPIDKIDAFRDTMNASYIPGAVSNIGGSNNNNQTFSKEFEKNVNVSFSKAEKAEPRGNKNDNKETETSSTRKTDDNSNRRTSGTDTGETNETKVNRQPDIRSKEQVKYSKPGPQNETKNADGETGVKGEGENSAEKNQVDIKKAVHSENLKIADNQKTVNDKISLNETINRAVNKLGSMKEILRDNQVKTEAMVEGKEEVKEKFGDAQKLKSGTNVEKVMLKSLESSNQEAKGTKSTSSNTDTQTHTDKVNDLKSGEEITVEKKDVSDIDVEKKADKSTVKNESKLQTTNNRQDNGTVHFADNSKETRQLNEIKMKEVFTRNNTAEQYEVLKDKIVTSVQDSIQLMVNEGDSRATIQLHPPELGKIQVELIVKDNQVSAKINTDNVAVKEVILTNLNQLKSNIENAGIEVDKFDVEVGDFKNQFDGELSDGSSSSGERRDNSGNQELQDNDWLPDKVIKQQALNYFLGRSINFLV
jgi:flagellar hook-length control protein FliK